MDEFATKYIDLMTAHSDSALWERLYHQATRAIERGTTSQPFGCLTVENGQVSLAETNVPAGSSRSGSRT